MSITELHAECEKRDPLQDDAYHTVKRGRVRGNANKFKDRRPPTAHHAKKGDWVAWLLGVLCCCLG